MHSVGLNGAAACTMAMDAEAATDITHAAVESKSASCSRYQTSSLRVHSTWPSVVLWMWLACFQSHVFVGCATTQQLLCFQQLGIGNNVVIAYFCHQWALGFACWCPTSYSSKRECIGLAVDGQVVHAIVLHWFWLVLQCRHHVQDSHCCIT